MHTFPSSQFGAAPPTHTPPEQVSPVVHALPSLHDPATFVCAQPVAGMHESAVHTLLSLQFGAAPPTHTPAEQASPVVHAFPSLHGAVLCACWQPEPGLHESVVHTFPSSQFGAAPPTHAPAEHASPVVHAFPSSHAPGTLVCAHPVAGTHESAVHTFPSSQFVAIPPVHAPAAHVSPVVHASPSLHETVLLACTQPVAGEHESSVHTFPSSQFVAIPPVHAPAAHVSPVVHAFPSLHGAVLFACWQPDAGAHESVVHAFPSSQLGAGPPTHTPPEQVSGPLHALPSLHGAAFAACRQPASGSHESSVHGFPSSHRSSLSVNTHPADGSHESVVHAFPSSHATAVPLEQTPAEQRSPTVHRLPSLHGASLFACTHPVAASQESSVHTLRSSHRRGGPPTHDPAAHRSPIVHAFPSLHGAVPFTCTQPVAASHESSVHTIPSSQFGAGPPTHTPPEQLSPIVHALPSLHDPVTFACAQPVAGMHESAVHTLPSSQFGGAPPTHDPPEQVSPVVHAFPSLQAAVLLACWQPDAGMHESVVHTFPSSQFGAGPPTHAPPEQVSAVVHALPSLQGAVLFACWQPDTWLHESVVHTFPSSQLGAGPPTHAPPEQASPVVHAFPSLHGPGTLAWAHPVAGMHESAVHTFASSQLGAGPPTHTPAAQASPVVHALPSLHGAVLFACWQPEAGLHESVVHTFPSSQLGAGPPTHTPPEQASPVVHALPSLHEPVTFVCAQPVAGTHESAVHTFPSLQFAAAPPTHTPPEQVSAVVHAFPSLHGAVLFACRQPDAGLHESVVHTFPSSQLGAGPPTHAPPEQASPVVHALPSLHGAVLFACRQPDTELHESVVHTFPSSQLSRGPPTQSPAAHWSPVVQTLPSLHGAVLLMWAQPETGSHESSVQGFASSQLSAPPLTHVPPEHRSPEVQAFPSLHEIEFATCTHPESGLQESSVQAFPSSQFRGGPAWHEPASQTSPTVHALPSLHGAAFSS